MQGFTDKEILNDGLCAQKASTGKLNLAATECVHAELRDKILNVLDQEHDIQYEVFNMMSQRGLYPTPAAEDKKVMEAKQKFAQSYKSV